MKIKQRSIGFEEERHIPYFEENKIEPDKYIRNLIDEDIKKKNQFQFLPLTEAKETDFIDLDQIYPVYESNPTFAPEGWFRGNIKKPKFIQLVLDLPEDFRKNFIEHAERCRLEHIPFAYADCISDFKNGKFVSFLDYSDLKDFKWVDGVLRFKFKNAYELEKSPESMIREKLEFEQAEIKRANERNQVYNEELRIRQLASQLQKEEFEKKAREIIQKEKLFLSELSSSSLASPIKGEE